MGGHRHLVEFRGPTELQTGESVTVEAFEAGDRIKVAGTSIGKGFQGTIKRHNFHRGPVSHGSHNVRKPGSIGASATPSRVFKGKKMAGRMGGKRATQLGLVVHGDRRRAQPDPRPRRRPGPEERARRDQGSRSDGRQGAGSRRLGEGRRARRDGLRGRREAAPRARDRARGAECRARRDAWRQEPRARRRRPREAVAPEGHRAAPARARSARRSSRAAAWPSRPGCGASR